MKPFVRGGAFLLALLVFLTLLAFATLGLTAAWADLKLARAAATWTVGYYAMEREANERVRDANRGLKEIYEAHGDYPHAALETLDGWAVEADDTGRLILSRDVASEDRARYLRVELLPVQPVDGKYYALLAWRQWQDRFVYETEGIELW